MVVDQNRLLGKRFSYNNIATNTTTTVKSGSGVLHSIVINKKGASSNLATVYDNTAGSGTKIATIDTTTSVVTLLFDCQFSIGLTIVTATGTAADITVSYA
jgi:thymidine phosphorylase